MARIAPEPLVHHEALVRRVLLELGELEVTDDLEEEPDDEVSGPKEVQQPGLRHRRSADSRAVEARRSGSGSEPGEVHRLGETLD